MNSGPVSHSGGPVPPHTPECQVEEINGIESYCKCQARNTFGCPHVLATPWGRLCWHPQWEILNRKADAA